MIATASFLGAAFAADGELIGTRERPISELSPKWLKVCNELMELHGPSFKIPLEQNLSHIQIELTSASGAALCALSVHGVLTLTTACFSGSIPSAETQLQSMMLTSLRATSIVHVTARSGKAFESLLGIQRRPLCVLVFWGPDSVSEQDNALVRELAEHLAGSFFLRGSCGVA